MALPINMPAYRSHKVVQALRIEDIEPMGDGGATITPSDAGFEPFTMAREFMLRHHPVAGGYLVRYEDGYASFSPAKAFEEGYTLIEASDG